jgi:hypothetical protein
MTIVKFRLPLREGRPTPKLLAVQAGTYRTERGEEVSVPEQVGQVDGWHFDYPQMHVVLRVKVQCNG